MPKIFASIVEFQTYMENACRVAIEKTSQIAKDKLIECIASQYYLDPAMPPNFPKVYERTQQFLNSVATKLLNPTTANIYIDMSSMDYEDATPEEVVNWAAESSHGGLPSSSTVDFWTTFVEWCNENLVSILKSELIAQGISVK